MVLVGHVDHGKSTLVGRLFYETGLLPAGWRGRSPHCLLFNPPDPRSARYNPLLEVRKGPHEVRDVQNIADILVDAAGIADPKEKAKIAKARQAGHELTCEVCGFNFEQVYGDRGRDYIECHHRAPLFSTGRTTTTLPAVPRWPRSRMQPSTRSTASARPWPGRSPTRRHSRGSPTWAF